MMPFLLFRVSRTGLFSDLSMWDSCPLRIPLDKLWAAVSPTDKSRKDSVFRQSRKKRYHSLFVHSYLLKI